MDFKDFTLGKNDDNRRLDKVIRIFADVLSLSEVYKYLRKGLIRVNGKKAKPETKVFENDKISIADFIVEKKDGGFKSKTFQSDSAPCPPAASPLPSLSVIYENSHILIIDKPYDIAVHGKTDSLEKAVEQYYALHKKEDSLSFKPGPLHRLDRKTTGLLCFSMSLEGARWFSQNIKTHNIQKKYAALVSGKVLKAYLWEDEIKKIDDDKNFKTVSARKASASKMSDDDGYKTAVSEVTPIAYGKYREKDVSLVSIDIKTGRTHQIRAQFALHKHPLLGDTAYGGVKITGKTFRDFFLTAYELSFPKDNPLGLPSIVRLPFPKDFKSFLTSCFIKDFGL